MAFASTFRLGALVALILCSLVVLGLSAHLASLSEEAFAFEGLGIATAAITIATVPLMVGVDLTRKGAFTSMVVVELTWLGQLNRVLFPYCCGSTDKTFGSIVFLLLFSFDTIKAILWVLWLATGAEAIQIFNLAFIGCDNQLDDFDDFELSDESTCRETQAVAAFGFLGWIIFWFSSVHNMKAYDSKEGSMSQTHNMSTMQSHHTQQV
ncbi:hypothetical protein K435DRAFT_780439 [Dendrothele bispora CBS 962.96]|uniref:MARVEL domain-containing protein n=1 Tax=Dendrothele bispora (strain CBS 962.96) TaxID=1314807 RepID=A0A4S8LRF2_DENBC|nr:hypothetical protein K435DRAFT_780439 [Dendrothele bispora CBS 962.96]